MDVREKLVEILKKPIFPHEMVHPIEAVADYLLDSGVTVQEWISVNDMLPEPTERAICINCDGDMMIGTYTEWGWMFPCYFKRPTHWMQLPKPPKGE